MGSYFVITLCAVFCAVLYYVLIKLRIYRVKHRVRKECNKETILLKSLKLENKVAAATASGALDGFKVIPFYLLQCTHVVDGGIPAIDSAVIRSLDRNSELTDTFLSELKQSPDEIIKLVLEQCVINDQIWMINNPIRAKINEIRVDFMCAFLSIALKLLKMSKVKRTMTDIQRREEYLRENSFWAQIKKTGIIVA